MTGRRGLLAALGGCLLGAALVLIAAGRPWVRAEGAAELAAGLGVRLTGRQVAGAVAPLALVGLGGAVAIVASRGRQRLLVAAVLSITGGAVCWLAGRVLADPAGAARTAETARVGIGTATATGWPWVAATGGLLLALTGALVAVRGRHWPAMSGRYDREPASARIPASPEVALWEALDRGDDPT